MFRISPSYFLCTGFTILNHLVAAYTTNGIIARVHHLITTVD
ncbi:hypothetical protein [Gardnerella sp. DNF01180P]